MRLLPYYAFISTLAIAALAALSTKALLHAQIPPPAHVIVLTAASVHHTAVGAAIVTNWRGSMRRLRALQRIQRRGKGRLWRWICRDTLAWWRAGGAAIAATGIAYAFAAILVALY